MAYWYTIEVVWLATNPDFASGTFGPFLGLDDAQAALLVAMKTESAMSAWIVRHCNAGPWDVVDKEEQP